MVTFPALQLQPFNIGNVLSQFDQGGETADRQSAQDALSEFGFAAAQGDRNALEALFEADPKSAAQLFQVAQTNALRQAQLSKANRRKPPTGFTFNDPNNPAAGVTPIPGFIEGQTILKQAGRPQVNVNTNIPPLEKEEQKATGKFFGEQFTTMQKAGTDAQKTLQNIARFEQLSEKTATGTVEEQLLPLKRAMVNLGFATQGQADQVSNLEGLLSLATEFSLKFVGETKGAVSDAEMALFLRAAPNIGNTPEGNELILDKAEQIAKNQIEIAKLQRRYRQGKAIVIDGQTFKSSRSGTVEGFQDVVDAFHAANPLFTAQEQQQLQSGAFVANDTTGQQTQNVPVGTTASDGQGNTVIWDGQQWVPQ